MCIAFDFGIFARCALQCIRDAIEKVISLRRMQSGEALQPPRVKNHKPGHQPAPLYLVLHLAHCICTTHFYIANYIALCQECCTLHIALYCTLNAHCTHFRLYAHAIYVISPLHRSSLLWKMRLVALAKTCNVQNLNNKKRLLLHKCSLALDCATLAHRGPLGSQRFMGSRGSGVALSDTF